MSDSNGLVAEALRAMDQLPIEEPKDAPAPPPQVAAVKKLTPEERLQIENCYLKVQNLHLQTEKLREDVIKAASMRMEEQRRMEALKSMLGAKYQVDMDKVQIHPDGTIIENPPQV